MHADETSVKFTVQTAATTFQVTNVIFGQTDLSNISNPLTIHECLTILRHNKADNELQSDKARLSSDNTFKDICVHGWVTDS